MVQKNERTFTICHIDEHCCPKVIIDAQDNVRITDDFGGEVKITPEQWGILVDKIKSGELA